MVQNEDGHSALVICCSPRYQLIAAVVVAIFREEFERLRKKHPKLDRNSASRIACSLTDKEEADRIISTAEFIRAARTKCAVVDRECKKLLEEAGIDPDLPAYGKEHLEALQTEADKREMRIVYFDRDKVKKRSMLEWSGKRVHNSIIPITHFRGKIELLRSASSLFKVPFCGKCLRSGKRTHHRCGTQDTYDCDNPSSPLDITCADCNVHFNSRSCYDRHLRGSSNGMGNRCGLIHVCTLCSKTWNKAITKEHVCGEYWCARCLRHHKPSQWCSWPEVKQKKKDKARAAQEQFKFFAWDVETVQSLPGAKEQTPHYVNLIVIQWACHLCHDNPDFACANCGLIREEVFKWESPDDRTVVRRFLKFVLTDKRMNGRIGLAHNSGNHFLVDELVKMGVKAKYTIDSMSIVSIEILAEYREFNSVKFKDSFRFLTCPLSDFPKYLGLESGPKGIYPYYYNHPNFYGTVLDGLPDDKYYGEMTEKKREEFEEYKRELPADFKFDMEWELINYCKQDVRVLLAGVIKFSTLLKKACNWCPIVQCNTLPAFTLLVYRYEYAVASDHIYLPEHGLDNGRILQSEIGLKWLHWIEHKLERPIKHAGHVGGEEKIKLGEKYYYVDGYDSQKNVCYEFLGCYWHGCRFCFPDGNEVNPSNGLKMKQLYANTMARLDALRAADYTVIIKWECELERNMDQEMKDFFATCDVRKFVRLRARDPLFGGRTENWRYKVEAEEGETIYYLDITSMYSAQMFFNEFATGEPTVLDTFTKDQVETLPFRGFIKAAILPPKSLRKPMIPYRCGDRLTFPVCATCAETQNKDVCNHSDEQRMLIGTWTSIEVKKGLSLGYRLVHLYEVYHWRDEQWKSGIYADYIRNFYKIKLCASGWPEDLRNDDEKEAYLQWHRGKMSQRDSLTSKDVVSSEELFVLLSNPARKVLSWRNIGDQYFVAHKSANEDRHSSPFACLQHACFITALGRLKLYSLMEHVGENLVYVDTDSLIFVCAKGEPNPLEYLVTGYMGQLTSEVPKGKRIKSVICAGPKSYTIRYDDGTELVKCKGIHQTETTSNLDYDGLEKIVKGEFEGKPHSITVQQTTISRPQLGTIVTRKFEKVIRFVNRKSGVEGTDYKSAVNVPFGYG